MMGVQHKTVGIGFGIATALYVAEGLGEPAPAIISLATATIGCMLPDIDHDKTKIGRKRKLVTDVLGKLTTTAILGIIGVSAVLVALLSVGVVNAGIDIYSVGIALVGGILFIGARNFMQNNKTVRWLTKHRGFMHTAILPILIFIMANASEFVYWRFSFVGLGVGYVSHLLADMLTVEGCPVLWPISKSNIRFLKLKTKNASTWLAAFVLAAAPVLIMIAYLEGIL